MVGKAQINLGKLVLRLLPGLYLRRQLQWAQSHARSDQTFFLTFDCDTGRDAKAALKIQHRLHQAGMRAGYAIPGELLRDHWDDYQKLLTIGGYLINHGYREHAAIDSASGRLYSTFSYRDVDDEVWQQDIIDGHNTIAELTGNEPRIFRTPHFGEFNTPGQLKKLYRFLAKNGYRLSSSTTPVFGFLNGSVHTQPNGLIEFPLSGSLVKPTQLVDSWGYIAAPDALGRDALIAELERYLTHFSLGEIPFTNIYFDPADIVNDEEVLDLLVRFKPYCHPGYDKYLGSEMSN
ncbi:polysaccharide deacetylase family protein [Thalassospira sp.]|uniref:polysaccharide deacetylase family protein n=1 Tax=Thalassospira sp. TaxID=1912094 RepID=UPI001B1D5F01|nr:polysaccharide deacetylase family protein [Thalassospira sp.]MBO6806239.1 hypothetical protein [Thalassospira sp.]